MFKCHTMLFRSLLMVLCIALLIICFSVPVFSANNVKIDGKEEPVALASTSSGTGTLRISKEVDWSCMPYIYLSANANKDTVKAGDEIEYTINISFSNYEGINSFPVQLYDELPSDLTFVSLTDGKSTWTEPTVDNLYDLGYSSSGGTITVTLKAIVNNNVVSGQEFWNLISVKSHEAFLPDTIKITTIIE